MAGLIQQLEGPSGSTFSLSFGLRAAAIVVVVIASLVLGSWVREITSSFPSRGVKTSAQGPHYDQRIQRVRTVSSRALGWFAFFCVLLAGLVAVAAIVDYGQPGTPIFDPLQALSTFYGLAKQIIGVLLLVPATLAVGRLLQEATAHALPKRVDSSLRVLAGRIVYVSVLILGALVVLYVLGVPLVLPVAVVGVITLGLSLALQDVLRNLFAGVYLLVERPFVIGDEITVTAFTGVIEDIHLRITSLRARDGQRVLVPNSILFTSAVVNATAQDRRPATLTMTLPSAAATDFGQLEERILSTLAEVKDVRQQPGPSVVLNRAGQGKLDVQVEFWVSGAEDATQTAVSDAITHLAGAFSEADVSLAAPAAST